MNDFMELARAAESAAAIIGVYAGWLEENGQEEAALWLRDTTGESGFSDGGGTGNNADDALRDNVGIIIGTGFGDGFGYGDGFGEGQGYGYGYGIGDGVSFIYGYGGGP